ncbi:MAG: division/cell wall cluster transcriptional repressor MraZ [Bdellovibrionota bacterium]
MFRGSFEHNIDEKGRVAVPATFRKLLTIDDEPTSLVVTNSDKCLVAYPIDKWEQLEKKLASLSQFDPKVVAFQRYFIASAVECPIDKAGRVLLPNNLRKFAGIEKECFFIGNLTKFEIWSSEAWKATISEITDNFGALAESMGEMGISL